MHRTLILHKDHLLPLLRKLKKNNRLVAPVRNSFGDTFYSEIEDLEGTAIDLDHQSQSSLKSFFLPQSETLSRYVTDRNPESGRLEYSFHAQVPITAPTVYFGVRSCDLFGVLYTDLVFRQARERDIYYARRREDAVFITIGCARPFADCFCNATRSGPFLEGGYDLQISDLGDRWFVQIGRPRGVRLVEEWPAFFIPATEEDKKAQFQVELEARGLFARHVHVDLAVKLLQELPDPTAIFADLSSRCQDCGGCAYLCPTCTCFNITDQRLDEESGERQRIWDACTFAGFNRMAGDCNPVDAETGRVRKRFLHKLLHDVRRHGRPSCVGCGRCVGMCFGGVDIIRFIDMLTAAGENGAGGRKR